MTNQEKEKVIEYYKFSSTGEAKTILDLIQENKELQSQINKLMEKYDPTINFKKGSKYLTCPNCKSKNIEINHKAQSFRCINCEEGWAS